MLTLKALHYQQAIQKIVHTELNAHCTLPNFTIFFPQIFCLKFYSKQGLAVTFLALTVAMRDLVGCKLRLILDAHFATILPFCAGKVN